MVIIMTHALYSDTISGCLVQKSKKQVHCQLFGVVYLCVYVHDLNFVIIIRNIKMPLLVLLVFFSLDTMRYPSTWTLHLLTFSE